jgi:hypothetical protein
MSALIPNVAKGRFAHYATLPAANDALVWLLWTGVETDANVRDTDTVTTMIALGVNEATFPGYSRQVATGVVVTVDDTNDRVDVDAADPSWTSTGSEALTRISLNYDPDTTGGTDADLVPVFVDDFILSSPASGVVGYTVAIGGWGRDS